MNLQPPAHYLKYRNGSGGYFIVVDGHRLELLWTEEQLQEAADVEISAFDEKTALTVEDLRKIAANGFVYGIRDDKGTLVGVGEVVIQPMEDAPEVLVRNLQPHQLYGEGLAVRKSAEGRNYASLLGAGFEALAKGEGKKEIVLTVSLNNHRSLSVVFRRGYVGIAVDLEYYKWSDFDPGARLILRLDLCSPPQIRHDPVQSMELRQRTKRNRVDPEDAFREAQAVKKMIESGLLVTGFDVPFGLGEELDTFTLFFSKPGARIDPKRARPVASVSTKIVRWVDGLDNYCLDPHMAGSGRVPRSLQPGDIVMCLGPQLYQLGDLYLCITKVKDQGRTVVVRPVGWEANRWMVDSSGRYLPERQYSEVATAHLGIIGSEANGSMARWNCGPLMRGRPSANLHPSSVKVRLFADLPPDESSSNYD